jgi:hypothetical protein
MKPPKNSTLQAPSLSDMIEIIRDPQPPSVPEVSFPPDIDDSNPLYMLNQLVEKIEAVVGIAVLPDEHTTDTANLFQSRFHSVASDIERYIELFQKQSAVLRKIMPKLH